MSPKEGDRAARTSDARTADAPGAAPRPLAADFGNDPALVGRPPGLSDGFTEPALDYPVRQTGYTRLPSPDDGLEGNRQIALTPFPNLHLQSGPLAADQLPWHHRVPTDSPASVWRNTDFQSVFGFTKSAGIDDTNFGNLNTLTTAMPFWTERQIGLQLGLGVEPNTFPTIYGFVTAGIFRRALWPDDPEARTLLRNRLSWGLTTDVLYDSEHRGFIGQARNQFAFSLAPDREVGLWFTIPLADQRAGIGSNWPILLDTSAQFTVYLRRTTPAEMDWTAFMGVAEDPGGLFVGGYGSWRFADRMSVVGSTMLGLGTSAPFSLFAGVEYHFRPLTTYGYLSGNPENRYRPFLRTADHINLIIRKRRL